MLPLTTSFSIFETKATCCATLLCSSAFCTLSWTCFMAVLMEFFDTDRLSDKSTLIDGRAEPLFILYEKDDTYCVIGSPAYSMFICEFSSRRERISGCSSKNILLKVIEKLNLSSLLSFILAIMVSSSRFSAAIMYSFGRLMLRITKVSPSFAASDEQGFILYPASTTSPLSLYLGALGIRIP